MYLSVWKVPALVPHADWLNRLVYLFVHLFVCLFVCPFIFVWRLFVFASRKGEHTSRQWCPNTLTHTHTLEALSTRLKIVKIKYDRSLQGIIHTVVIFSSSTANAWASRSSHELRSLCWRNEKRDNKNPDMWRRSNIQTKNKQVSISLNSFNWFLCRTISTSNVCRCIVTAAARSLGIYPLVRLLVR